MKLLLSLFCCWVCVTHFSASAESFSQEEKKASDFYNRKSYAQAAAIWSALLVEGKNEPDTPRATEVRYRVADASWRALSGSDSTDETAFAPWKKALLEIAESTHAEWAAKANESLGDFFMLHRRNYQNFYQARPYYLKALDYWAASDASEESRQAYLRIVVSVFRHQGSAQVFQRGAYEWGPDVCENAVMLAKSREEIAQTSFLLALALWRQSGSPNPALWDRIKKYFVLAMLQGRGTEWHDDVLFYAAQWSEERGSLQENAPGQYTAAPDFSEAARLYQELIQTYPKGKSYWYDRARTKVKTLTEPQIDLEAGMAFSPDSLLRFNFTARNLSKVDFSIRKLDLVKALNSGDLSTIEWYKLRWREENLRKGLGKEVRTWSEKMDIPSPHAPVHSEFKTESLPIGAYWLEARGKGSVSGTLFLVTDAVINVIGGKKELLLYGCHGMSGEPLPATRVRLLRYVSSEIGGQRRVRTEVLEGMTDKDGVCRMALPPLPDKHYDEGMAIVSQSEDSPSLLMQNSYRYTVSPSLSPKAYVYTDRPAYRPGDTAQFKVVFRSYENGIPVNPPEQRFKLRINDPRGTKLLEKEYTLSAFGTLDDRLEIPKPAVLGPYYVQMYYWSEGNRWAGLGGNTLFRIEEYKLPEFRVEVKMPEKDGRPRTFRLGDMVSAQVQVNYYSGGVVPNAKVKYEIYQEPFYGDNPWPEPYPWLYRNFQSSVPWMCYWRPQYGGSLIKQGETVTDGKGAASVEFQTPAGSGNDLKYRVVAKVTDASRREISGEGSVKVTAQPFQINIRPEAQVYLPGDTAVIKAKAKDPNGNPQAVPATLVITREIYLKRYRKSKKTGKERLVFSGYEGKEMERREISFDEQGEFRGSFKPEGEGYYKIRIVSPSMGKAPAVAKGGKSFQTPPNRIVGETRIFVANKETQDLGYRYGALQIFPDKQTYHVGDTAKLAVISPSDGGAALVTVEGDDILSHELVRFRGTVKLLEIPITETCQPNIFFNAFMIKEAQVMIAREEAVVPPEEHFLTIDVKPDESDLKPGAKCRYDIQVRDTQGRPVKAELSLAVVDASIFYIQSDLSGDIREFFFGNKHYASNYVRSMLHERALRTISENEEEEEIREEFGADESGYYPNVLSKRENNLLRGRRKDRSFYDRNEGDLMAGGTMLAMDAAAPASAFLGEMEGRSSAVSGVMEVFDSVGGSSGKKFKAEKQDASNSGSEAIVVRSDFRATALWEPSVQTDETGKASISFDYPESLTEWKALARAVTKDVQIGQGENLTRTRQPIMVRLQTPRFLVEGDRATLSAVLNNESGKNTNIVAKIESESLVSLDNGTERVRVKPNEQARVERRFEAKTPKDKVKVTATAKSAEGNDGMEYSLPVVEHGMEKFIGKSLVVEPSNSDKEAKSVFVLDVPDQRRAGSEKLTLLLSPSLASTCLDALPYLAHYPYGCVEQTLSRFVPAVITAQTLKEMGLSSGAVEDRIFGGVNPASAKALKMKKGKLGELDVMIRNGVQRLSDMQHNDGGWGWWKEDHTDDFMTAYVVQGLALANKAGVGDIPLNRVRHAMRYLDTRLVRYENDLDMTTWLLYGLALSDKRWSENARDAADRAWKNRERLNAYTHSLLALAFHMQAQGNPTSGYEDRAKILVENLENGVIETKAESSLIGPKGSATMPVTCHWGRDGIHYRWSEGGVEATAFALRAILAIDPANPRLDQAARWLINNRRSAQWKNTRDTAIVILSLLEYMKKTGEIDPKLKVSLSANGKLLKETAFSKDNALGLFKIEVDPALIRSGENRIECSVVGKGRLYASAYLTYFTKEKPIQAAGNEIYVKREYYRVASVPRLIGGVNFKRSLLKDGDEVKSGDRIEVNLTFEAKNNYEYLLFEDRKPAGCEAVKIRSGEPVYAQAQQADGAFKGTATYVYQELKEQWVAFFISKLRQGSHRITYDLRAETPGTFHALPTTGQAMYVPEIRANGDEVRISITD